MRAPARLRHARDRDRGGACSASRRSSPASRSRRPRAARAGAALRVRRAARRDRRVRGDGVGAVRARLLDQVRRRERRARDARPLHVHRGVGGARGFDPAVGARALGVRRGHDVALPRARDDPLVAWATLVQLAVLLLLLRADAVPGQPVQADRRDRPARRPRPEPAAAEPSARRVPPADALRRATSASRSRSRSRSPRSITGRFGEGWLADVRRTTLVAWGFLTVGIVLGAWWSYEVLGWGGYWGWDPVENASLLPWLTGDRVHPLGDGAGTPRDAARLEPVARARDVLPHDPRHVPHPFRRRQLGARVHASRRSGRGCSRSSASVAVGGVGLIAWRGDKLRTPGRIDSPVSREAAFLLNNLLFAGVRARRAHGHGVPAARRGAAGQAAHGRRAVLRRDRRADRHRAAVPHGGRARAAVARRERRGAAQRGC